MSDSDTDLLPNNVLTFQNQGTTVSARGPNLNSTNISSLSFRNNVMTSAMNMPWNTDRPRYAESVYDQRSMYYNRERETSPMSFHSASGMHSRNLHHSFYPGAMSSHRSMYNGRSGSPMSVRTIDSNTSISAKDIAFAFENGTFTKFDFKIIKDAYNRFMKSRTRKRVEKRRNIRMFLKGFRRRSGGDSGDQASNSSISSDDGRSVKTSRSRSTVYKENMSSCRSTKTDISDFRRTVRESNMFRDCSDNFRQNSLKSMFSASSLREREKLHNLQQKWQNKSMANSVSDMQRDRFKNGFILPSQRFNYSVAALPIPEKPNRLQKIYEGNLLNSNGPNKIVRQDRNNLDTDSEQEEIFADVTVMEKTSFSNNAKRILEEDDIPMSDKKRTKLSPPKNNPKQKNPIQNQPKAVTNQKSNDFVFAKPQPPLKKPTIAKQKLVSKSAQPKSAQQPKAPPPKENPVMPTVEDALKPVELPVEKVISSSKKAVEKLISKSSQPLESVKKISEKEVVQKLPQNIELEKENCLPTDITQHSTSDMSMRPSFIKRKLFTQKIDVAEKNSSSDSLQADSPQTNVYSKIQKEKNGARKLVTTQSCLNRDVGDDSNLLDLIHKIVPADRMNVTNATNRTDIQNNRSKPADHDKFDVTSVITSCNNTDDVSDTYTDEEIFTDEKQQQNKISKQKNENKSKVSKPKEHIKDNPQEIKKKVVNVIKQKSVVKEHNINNEMPASSQCKPAKQQIQKTSKYPNCKVVVQKLQPQNSKEPLSVLNDPNSPTERNGLIKANVYKGVKSFWDTDSESDLEPLKRAGPKNSVAKNLEIVGTRPIIEATPLKKAGSKNTVATNLEIVGTRPIIEAMPLKKAGSKNTVVTHPELVATPSKIDAAPPKRTVSKNAVLNPGTAEAPLKKVIAPVNKPPNNKLPQNGTKQTTQTKAAAKQKCNSSLINKEKETKGSNQIRRPRNITLTVEKDVVSSKTKTVEKTVKGKKTSASTKENKRPLEESTEVAKNVHNTSLCVQKDFILQQKNVKKATSKRAMSNINNNDSTLSNNELQFNRTLRIRAHRTPKVIKSCCEQDTSHNVTNNKQCNNTTLYRSLRSRVIDLSTSLNSDDLNTTRNKKTAPKNIRPAKNNIYYYY